MVKKFACKKNLFEEKFGIRSYKNEIQDISVDKKSHGFQNQTFQRSS